MVLPTAMLWACALVSAAAPALAGYDSDGTRPPVGLLRLAFAVAVSIWVTADARRHRRVLPYDFDSFLFFAWPVLGPYYLWQTRRWRAGLTLLWFLLLLTVASAVDVASALRGR